MKYAIKKQWSLTVAILIIIAGLSSCKKYLDIIPDNLATIDHAFAMRSEAEKYLYTCYSYMPRDGNLALDPSILGGDEVWTYEASPKPMFNHAMFDLALGRQATVNPVGEFMWVNLYKALRDCNIFLENVEKVPDLSPDEKREWIAEVKFLKAYYHFYLVRMYGPIPLIKVNLPVDVNISEVKITRAPVDSCFAYIKQLLDEAKDVLQPTINDPVKMLGRITNPIVYSLKAKVMVTAASPLFNGNSDQAGLKNHDGTQLFNQQVVPAKWDSAVVACKQAIEVCDAAGIKLYEFNPSSLAFVLSDQIKTQLSLRNAFAERWNSEIIWANTQSIASGIQQNAGPHLNPLYLDNPNISYELAVPMKIAEMFYTKNGVPITEDKTWVANSGTRVGTVDDQRYIKLNYETAAINFDREPRYYSSLGFDGGIWFGQGYYNDAVPGSTYFVEGKVGQKNSIKRPDYGSVTGYFVKKYVHFQSAEGAGNSFGIIPYPWPLIRLPQLYLMYAEALNEQSGPGVNVHKYINLVRSRAGLKSVEESWDTYANNTKYTTQIGMREIIHRESLIELAFEGSRFWDLKRWKEAPQELVKPIQGWDINQSTVSLYYRRQLVYSPKFAMKDYFWPIRDGNILSNRNLVQNLGW